MAKKKSLTLVCLFIIGVTGFSIPYHAYAASCDAIIGKWTWFTSGVATINPDGAMVYAHPDGTIANDGTWECTDAYQGMFTLRWRIGGYINSLALSAHGQGLSSTDPSQSYVTAKRIGAVATSDDDPQTRTPLGAKAAGATTDGEISPDPTLEAVTAEQLAELEKFGKFLDTIPQRRSESAKAIALARPLAEKGDATAQYELGVLYAEAIDVANRNWFEVARWFKAAAEQGHVQAQYRLAEAYVEGRGVRIDFTEALRWYKASAAQGNATAADAVSSAEAIRGGDVEGSDQLPFAIWAYTDGDFKTSLKEFRNLAEQGHPVAQYFLGEHFSWGKGVDLDQMPANEAEAITWYRRAAEQGHVWSQLRLGELYEFRAFGMHDADDAENLAEAKRWYHGTWRADRKSSVFEATWGSVE